jgi:hypothetical protein
MPFKVPYRPLKPRQILFGLDTIGFTSRMERMMLFHLQVMPSETAPAEIEDYN